MPIPRRLGLWLVATLISTGLARGQSLVDNGGFAGGASGWHVSGEGSWSASADDVDGDPGSGSVLLRNAETVAGTRTHPLDQCIAVAAPGDYIIGGSARVSEGQAAGRATLSIGVFTGSACDTGFVSGGGLFIPRTQAWTSIAFVHTVSNVPASLLLRVGVDKPGAEGTLEVQADDIYVIRSVRVFRSGFE